MPIKITQQHSLTRRHFIRGTGLAGGLAIGSTIHDLLSSCAAQSSSTKPVPKAIATPASNPKFVPDLEINLKAAPKKVSILPGKLTQVWSYAAELVKGDPASLQTMPDNYLGPIVRV